MYRIIYEISGSRHTFWSRETHTDEDMQILFATNVETGEEKMITLATPMSITEVDSVPPKVVREFGRFECIGCTSLLTLNDAVDGECPHCGQTITDDDVEEAIADD